MKQQNIGLYYVFIKNLEIEIYINTYENFRQILKPKPFFKKPNF